MLKKIVITYSQTELYKYKSKHKKYDYNPASYSENV